MTSESDRYTAGVPCWVDLEPDDPEAAVAFYNGLFGWDTADLMPPGAPGHYFAARLRGGDVAGIGSRPPGAVGPPAWRTYVWVDDAAATAVRATELGGSVLVPPTAVMDAGTMAVVADPEGAILGVWQAARHRGAQVVNEPGAWNFNALHTADPAGARAFYGGLFGWEDGELDPESGGGVMLRRPGYGAHLDMLTPGFLQRMADMGAPAGFEDAIGWLVPCTGGEAPHWDITFGVADADASAARAQELGGEVLMPPTDMPWVRVAVLRDPAGAVFTVSQFVPPDPAGG